MQDDQPALVIYSEFRGQLTDAVHSLLEITSMLLKYPQTVLDVCNQWTWLQTSQQRFPMQTVSSMVLTASRE